jgi:hypothetical protein
MTQSFILIGTDLLCEDNMYKFENMKPLLQEVNYCAKDKTIVFVCSKDSVESAAHFVEQLKDAHYTFVDYKIKIETLDKAAIDELSEDYNIDPDRGIYIDTIEEIEKVAKDNKLTLLSVLEDTRNRFELDFDGAADNLKQIYQTLSL